MRLQKIFCPFNRHTCDKISPTFTSRVEGVTHISRFRLWYILRPARCPPPTPLLSATSHSTFSTQSWEKYQSSYFPSKAANKHVCQNVPSATWKDEMSTASLGSLKWKHNKSPYWINGGKSLGLRMRSNNKVNLPLRCDANLFASPRRRLKKAPFIQSRMKRQEKREDARSPSLSEQTRNFKWFQWLRYSGGLH